MCFKIKWLKVSECQKERGTIPAIVSVRESFFEVRALIVIV